MKGTFIVSIVLSLFIAQFMLISVNATKRDHDDESLPEAFDREQYGGFDTHDKIAYLKLSSIALHA